MNEASNARRPLRQRISSNVLWAFVAEGTAKGAVFLLTVHIAATLGPESFGVFSFALTLFTFLWMGVDLGLGMYGTREVAKRRYDDSEIVSTISLMRSSLALVIGLATLAIFVVLPDRAIPLMLAVGFGLYILVRAVYADWFLKGREQYKRLAALSVVVALAMLASGYGLIRDANDLALASTPWLAGYAVGALTLLIFFGRSLRLELRPAFRARQWLEHWRESVHFTLSNGVSTTYQNLPLLSLYLLGDATITGVFAAPFRVVIAGVFVLSILPMAIYPVFSDLFAQGSNRVAGLVWKAAAAVAGLAALFAAPLWFGSERSVTWLFGSEYAESGQVLQILLLFFVLRSIRAVFVRVVGAAGQQREYSKIAFASVLVLAILLIGTRVYGLPILLATCWSLVIVEALTLVAMTRLTHRITNGKLGVR